MSSLNIRIVSKPYNKLLSRAEPYLREARLDEKYYFIEYFMFSSLLPSNNKIISCKKLDDGLLLKFKTKQDNLNTIKIFKNSKFFTDLEKKMYHNNLIFEQVELIHS